MLQHVHTFYAKTITATVKKNLQGEDKLKVLYSHSR
jgi:hypothetical protein